MAQLTELRTNLTADAENEEAEEALVAEEAKALMGGLALLERKKGAAVDRLARDAASMVAASTKMQTLVSVLVHALEEACDQRVTDERNREAARRVSEAEAGTREAHQLERLRELREWQAELEREEGLANGRPHGEYAAARTLDEARQADDASLLHAQKGQVNEASSAAELAASEAIDQKERAAATLAALCARELSTEWAEADAELRDPASGSVAESKTFWADVVERRRQQAEQHTALLELSESAVSTISGLVDRLEAQCARLTAEADTISSRLDGDVSVERKRLTDEGELAV